MLPQFRTILYATDLAEQAVKAFRYAISLARGSGARIVLLHALEPPGFTALQLMDSMLPNANLEALQRDGMANLESKIHERLSAFCKQELGPGSEEGNVIAEIRVRRGSPDAVILAEADAVGADVIVIGAHGRPAVERLLLGSVANKVIQRARVPVLVVPERD